MFFIDRYQQTTGQRKYRNGAPVERDRGVGDKTKYIVFSIKNKCRIS